MQFIIFIYAFSLGYLPLPWSQSTSISDRNGNILFLGKISILSLVLTLVSLLKAAMETFEIDSIVDQVWAAIYALLNLAFRIAGIAFIVIYLDIFSVPFFVVIFSVIYFILMKNREKNKEGTSSISTLAVSLCLPICISRSPELFQIKDLETDENKIIENKREGEKRLKNRVTVSIWIALSTNPLILLVDAIVFVLLDQNLLKQDSVWTNQQCKDFFIYFLCPFFGLSMFVSMVFYPLSAKKTVLGILKKVFSILVTILCFLGAIAVTIRFALVVEKLNRSSLVFVNNDNEIVLLQVIHKGNSTSCNDNGIFGCPNTAWNYTNFRTTHMIEGVGYVSEKIKKTDIEDKNFVFYDLDCIHYWENDAPSNITALAPHCKKCAINSILCRHQLLGKITGIQNCDGKF